MFWKRIETIVLAEVQQVWFEHTTMVRHCAELKGVIPETLSPVMQCNWYLNYWQINIVQ